MSIPSMTIRSLPLIAALVLLALPAFVAAQDVSASEEERLENLARAAAEVYVPKTTIGVGFRTMSSGSSIHFGNLGIVPKNTDIAPISEGEVKRQYNDGTVSPDSVRLEEVYSTTTPLPNGRYQTSGNVTDPGPDGTLGTDDDIVTNVVTGNGLSYQSGVTRNWSYTSDSQATGKPGYLAMSSYSATSDGGFREHKEGFNSGVEFQFSRAFGKLARRTEWSVTSGISLNSINGKANGTVQSVLRASSDYYSLNGLTTPSSPYGAPSFTDLYDASGNLLALGGLETTVPLATLPEAGLSTTDAIVGRTAVIGSWQVKGAYFMIKLGPSVRTQFSERMGLSASVGIAGAYAGSHYMVAESFAVPGDSGATVSTVEVSEVTKFLGGLYADLNFDWAANERTGLFAGISAQQFGGYDQAVGGRTARIDLGSTVGLRYGVTIRY
jgi:hypothetical protein